MSDLIVWLTAQADDRALNLTGFPRARVRPEIPAKIRLGHKSEGHGLRAHQFGIGQPVRVENIAAGISKEVQEAEDEQEQARRRYRGRSVAMLRRYMRYSIETGRLPSVLGREFFRAKVTSYTVATFEDRVIFVHDMERCLDRLDEFSRQLIARHILQEHDQAATGRLLQCTERTVRKYVPIVLDLFSEILLDVGLMERLESDRENSCQEGKRQQIELSECGKGKDKF